MGRRKVDRSDKVMQTFESTRPLRDRLMDEAKEHNMTISALIRDILSRHFEDRD